MAELMQPQGCYVADIDQGGQKVQIAHRCGSSDCPTNQSG